MNTLCCKHCIYRSISLVNIGHVARLRRIKTNVNEKFIDPRLQAKEALFEQLHLSTFDTMSYAHAVMQSVQENGYDVESDDENFQQLLRDFEVTSNLMSLVDTPLQSLHQTTSLIISENKQPNASIAQLCAAATNTLNHWRILCEIPEDLRDNEEVTGQLKANYFQHKKAWESMI